MFIWTLKKNHSFFKKKYKEKWNRIEKETILNSEYRERERIYNGNFRIKHDLTEIFWIDVCVV